MASETKTAGLVRALVAVIEEKDVYLRGHSERVANTCSQFLKKISRPQKEIEQITLAALLHDIGMIYLPQDLLEKPGRLSEDEQVLVRKHPLVAERILAPIDAVHEAVPIIRSHHEAYDGSGYPEGLSGETIPLGARILSLVDAYHAMTSPRPHRPALSMEEALDLLKKESGLRYDPELIEPFQEFIRTTIGTARTAQAENRHTIAASSDRLSTAITEIMLQFRDENIDLPVLPQIIQQTEEILNRSDSGADELAHIIENDAVISFRLLAAANSPVYRASDKISSVKQALMRMGMQEARNIIAAIAAKNMYSTGHAAFKMLLEKIWLHSLACAYGSRALARVLQCEDIETHFLMGLLHDIGKPLIINALTERLDAVDGLSIADVVKNIQEVHCRFGSILLLRWGFDRSFVKVAEQHEDPSFFASTKKEVLIVNVANNVTRTLGYSQFEDKNLDLLALPSVRELGLDKDTIDYLRSAVQFMMQETATVF